MSIAVADAPASPTDPRAAFYIVESTRPGTTIERRLTIRNDDAAPVHAVLYVGGAAVRSGALQFDDRASRPSPLATWSTVAPADLTLAPGAAADARVRIAVPDDAHAGEQLGVVWAETRVDGASGASVNRVGVRIYLAVATRAPVSDIELVAATPIRDTNGTPQVELVVRDAGGREIEPSGEVVRTDGARTSTPFAPGLALLPGTRGTLRASLATAVGADPTPVELRVRANGIERRAITMLTFPTRPGTRGDPVALDRTGGSSTTVPLALAVVLLALAALGVVRTRTRSLSRGPHTTWVTRQRSDRSD